MAPKPQTAKPQPAATPVDEKPTDSTPEPQEGEGIFIYEERSARYEGHWVRRDGVYWMHGRGKYTENNQTYEGEFVDDRMHGVGKYSFASGCVYEGHFESNLFSGEGIYRWPDSSRYEGHWREGKMHGEGTYTDKDGKSWHGEFNNGVGPGLVIHVH